MGSSLDDLPGEFDRAALERCLGHLKELTGGTKRVRITVTSDFVDAVRAVHEDAEYAEAYEQRRLLATAMAKTISQSDGSIDLIVDSSIFQIDAPDGTAEELFEHEARHIAIDERGETLSDIRLRFQGEALTVQNDLLAMAGVACEEFRVVRQVREKYPPPGGGHLVGFEEQARTFYGTVRDVCQAYQRDHDVGALARGVLDVFHALTTSSAYLAAELPVEGIDVAELRFADSVEELVLGEPWRDVLAALQKLPWADTPTDRAVLDRHAFELAGRLGAWLTAIGFRVEDVDGMTEFWVSRPMQWMLPIKI